MGFGGREGELLAGKVRYLSFEGFLQAEKGKNSPEKRNGQAKCGGENSEGVFSLARAVILKVWPGIPEVKTTFIIMLRHSFSLSFFHEYSVEFFRGHMTFDEVVTLVASGMCACVLSFYRF